MIESFGNNLAEHLFEDRNSTFVRALPSGLHRIARRKLLYLHDASDIRDLRVPPGYRLERLKRGMENFYSIRINDQWRLVFRWESGSAFEVRILDYH